MTVFLCLLIGAFAVAAAVALVRGMAAFFQDGEKIRSGTANGDDQLGITQNRMMIQRACFRASRSWLSPSSV